MERVVTLALSEALHKRTTYLRGDILRKLRFATSFLSINPSNLLFLRQLADTNQSKMGIQIYQ